MRQTVSIVKIVDCDFDTAVREAIEQAGGLSDLIRSDSRVLVKPNLCKPFPSGSGMVADARVTEAVTKAVLDCGPASVTIAEGAAVGYDEGSYSTEEVFIVSGTAGVAGRLGVRCVHLNSDVAVPVEVPKPRAMDRVLVARTVLESDVVISVPVLKTHNRVTATIALKNMYGVLPGTEKRAGHMLGINNTLLDLFSVLRPSFAVVDASVAMEGRWRSPEDSRLMGLVLAGKDALAADLVGCALMGIDPDSVMYLRRMMEWEGEVSGLGDVEVVGESVIAHAECFKPAFEAFLAGFPGVEVVQGPGLCGGCIAELETALRYLKKAGYEQEMNGLTIIVGAPEEFDAGDKVAVIGECSADINSDWPMATGCPPTEEDVIEALCAACDADPARVMSVRDDARREMWDSTRGLIGC